MPSSQPIDPLNTFTFQNERVRVKVKVKVRVRVDESEKENRKKVPKRQRPIENRKMDMASVDVLYCTYKIAKGSIACLDPPQPNSLP